MICAVSTGLATTPHFLVRLSLGILPLRQPQVAADGVSLTGAAAAVFGLAFILRAAGDASAVARGDHRLKDLSWASPLGWAHRVHAYDGERWWLLGVMLGACLALVGVAALLSVWRDVGAGLVRARLGRPTAKPSLRSPWALAWRLQRGALIAWAVGIAVGASVFGAIAHDVDSIVGGNPEAAKIFAQLGGAGALVDSYLSWVFGIAGVAAAAYAVSAVLRLRSEETGLRAEPVLATSVRRWQWLTSHVVVAVTGVVVLLATAGVVVGLVHGLISGRIGHELPRVLAAGLVQVPAALVLVAVGVALFGLLPRLVSAAAWLCVMVALLIGQLGAPSRWAASTSPSSRERCSVYWGRTAPGRRPPSASWRPCSARTAALRRSAGSMSCDTPPRCAG
jgi:ABC-2 type transport system permease protein